MVREYNLNDKEVAAVVNISRQERYAYLIKRVADWGTIWLLSDDHGDAMYHDESGKLHLPVWPFKRYVELCLTENWSSYSPRAVRLTKFLREDIPQLRNDSQGIVIFPTPADSGGCITADEFSRDLKLERSRM